MTTGGIVGTVNGIIKIGSGVQNFLNQHFPKIAETVTAIFGKAAEVSNILGTAVGVISKISSFLGPYGAAISGVVSLFGQPQPPAPSPEIMNALNDIKKTLADIQKQLDQMKTTLDLINAGVEQITWNEIMALREGILAKVESFNLHLGNFLKTNKVEYKALARNLASEMYDQFLKDFQGLLTRQKSYMNVYYIQKLKGYSGSDPRTLAMKKQYTDDIKMQAKVKVDSIETYKVQYVSNVPNPSYPTGVPNLVHTVGTETFTYSKDYPLFVNDGIVLVNPNMGLPMTLPDLEYLLNQTFFVFNVLETLVDYNPELSDLNKHDYARFLLLNLVKQMRGDIEGAISTVKINGLDKIDAMAASERASFNSLVNSIKTSWDYQCTVVGGGQYGTVWSSTPYQPWVNRGVEFVSGTGVASGITADPTVKSFWAYNLFCVNGFHTGTRSPNFIAN